MHQRKHHIQHPSPSLRFNTSGAYIAWHKLQSKRDRSFSIIQAGTLRSALHCLSYITAAVDPTEWAPALRPFTLLLRYSTDARPKVRKRAQYGLVDVLAALQGSPALQGASDAVLKGQSPQSSHSMAFLRRLLVRRGT